VLLGARGTQLAFATEDALVAVREKAAGVVTLTALDLGASGGLQGRRARTQWAFDVPEMGEGVVVYAGVPGIVLRSSKGLTVVSAS
jgi:hypothetical protein